MSKGYDADVEKFIDFMVKEIEENMNEDLAAEAILAVGQEEPSNNEAPEESPPLGEYLGFTIYVVDTETTGFDPDKNDVIEISMYRLTDNAQKTWYLKPLNQDTIEAGALRVNGHKLEDLKHETKAGRDTYMSPAKVLVDIENWMMEDGVTSEDRVLLGQNPGFDKNFLEKLWRKCGSEGTFPFGRKILDTIQITLMMDLATGFKRDAYGLSALVEAFGVKKEKAHRADADTRMTKELFLKQLAKYKEVFNK